MPVKIVIGMAVAAFLAVLAARVLDRGGSMPQTKVGGFLQTKVASESPLQAPPAAMVWIPGGICEEIPPLCQC